MTMQEEISQGWGLFGKDKRVPANQRKNNCTEMKVEKKAHKSL